MLVQHAPIFIIFFPIFFPSKNKVYLLVIAAVGGSCIKIAWYAVYLLYWYKSTNSDAIYIYTHTQIYTYIYIYI